MHSGGRRTKRFAVLKPGDNPKPRLLPPQGARARPQLRQGPRRGRARDDRPAPGRQVGRRRPVPDADRVLGLPGRGARRPAHARLGNGREPDPLAPAASTAVGSLIAPLLGFAVVSRADARQRLLRRRLRPLRPADDLRRLRRGRDRRRAGLGQGRQGRHGRDLLLGDHPAVHRRHAAAAPGRDLAHVGQRRPLPRHGLPGRDLELGLRAPLDRGADGGRAARAGGRSAVCPRARRGGRRATAARNQRLRLQTQDAVAMQERTPHRAPKLFRRPLARAVDEPDPGPDLPRRLVPGRADRRALRAEPRAPGRATRACGSRSRTASTPTRSGPSSITRWVEFLKLYVADEVPSRAPSRPRPERPALPLPRRRARGARAAVALRGRHRRRRRPRDVRAGPARPAADGERRRPGRPRARSARRGSSASAPGRSPRPSRPTFFLGAGGALTPAAPAPGHRRLPRRSRPPARRPRCPATATPTPGRRSRPTTGSRWRPARASASPRRRSRRTSSSPATPGSTCGSPPRRATPTCRSR